MLRSICLSEEKYFPDFVWKVGRRFDFLQKQFCATSTQRMWGKSCNQTLYLSKSFGGHVQPLLFLACFFVTFQYLFYKIYAFNWQYTECWQNCKWNYIICNKLMSTRLKVMSGQTLLFVNVLTVSFGLLWIFYTIGSCDDCDKYQLWLQLVWKKRACYIQAFFFLLL